MISTAAFAILFVLSASFTIGFTDTLMQLAKRRWGRYELHWKFDGPFPGPTRFWTRPGAQRFLESFPEKTEERLYIVDLKTKETFEA